MRTAIATAIVVAIGLDVVATAIGADKVGEKTHWYPPWLVGMGLTYELNYKDASFNVKIFKKILRLLFPVASVIIWHNQQRRTMAQRTNINTQEERRRLLGASIERLAVVYIGITARTYSTWIKNGATAKNIERIDIALNEYARKEAY
jgi:hypothetical protein